MRLFFGIGVELEENLNSEIPQIDGLFTGEKNCDGVLFYGMWKGYLEQPETKAFVEMMQERGVKLHILHTSDL